MPQVTAVPDLLCLRLPVYPRMRSSADSRCASRVQNRFDLGCCCAQELRFRQCSARGGELAVRTDWAAGRVRVSGGAVLVLSGQLYLP